MRGTLSLRSTGSTDWEFSARTPKKIEMRIYDLSAVHLQKSKYSFLEALREIGSPPRMKFEGDVPSTWHLVIPPSKCRSEMYMAPQLDCAFLRFVPVVKRRFRKETHSVNVRLSLAPASDIRKPLLPIHSSLSV